jgi:hypothetical protein
MIVPLLVFLARPFRKHKKYSVEKFSLQHRESYFAAFFYFSKYFRRSNVLAYFVAASITTNKRFIAFTTDIHRACTI